MYSNTEHSKSQSPQLRRTCGSCFRKHVVFLFVLLPTVSLSPKFNNLISSLQSIKPSSTIFKGKVLFRVVFLYLFVFLLLLLMSCLQSQIGFGWYARNPAFPISHACFQNAIVQNMKILRNIYTILLYKCLGQCSVGDRRPTAGLNKWMITRSLNTVPLNVNGLSQLSPNWISERQEWSFFLLESELPMETLLGKTGGPDLALEYKWLIVFLDSWACLKSARSQGSWRGRGHLGAKGKGEEEKRDRNQCLQRLC